MNGRLPACAAWPMPSDRTYGGLHEWHAGRCGLCGSPSGELVVDHDHTTGLVRGLLCRGCNASEGWGNAAPAFVAWRTWVNSSLLLGFREQYLDFYGMTEVQKRDHAAALGMGPRTVEQMRAAIVAMENAPTPSLEEYAAQQWRSMRRAAAGASEGFPLFTAAS